MSYSIGGLGTQCPARVADASARWQWQIALIMLLLSSGLFAGGADAAERTPSLPNRGADGKLGAHANRSGPAGRSVGSWATVRMSSSSSASASRRGIWQPFPPPLGS